MIPLDHYIDRLCGAGGPGPAVISIIGCGGKTTLLNYVSRGLRALRPEADLVYGSTVHTPAIISMRTGAAFPYTEERFNGLLSAAGIAVMECDGSRGLPLKGWADYEPVIPARTTLTVGILPVWTLGKPASAAIIHRLPLFLEQSGAAGGEALRPAHLARLIAHPRGMFAKARGRRLLFFNQIDELRAFPAAAGAAAGKAAENAARVAALLPPAFRRELAGIIAGSALQGAVAALD